jgi:limonene-1,2-epoxide hydrolase
MIGPESSGRALAKLVASLPATVDPATIRSRIAGYYATYATNDITARESLFAADCRFEDPAGHVVATDGESLHHFFIGTIPATWSIDFRLDRVAVVGNEALSTSTMTLRVGDRLPVHVVVNAHFVVSADGLITSVRTFFDEAAMRDAGPA